MKWHPLQKKRCKYETLFKIDIFTLYHCLRQILFEEVHVPDRFVTSLHCQIDS